MKIKVSDFSISPLMRHCSVSECSGEQYYHEHLNQAFKNAIDANEKLEVDLDGVEGYSPSFIDEIFGNLVYDFSLKTVSSKLAIISVEEPDWIESIKKETYPQWEERRKKGMVPIITARHNAWWRLNENNQLEQRVWEEPSNG